MKTTLEFSPQIFGSNVSIRVSLMGISNEQLHKKAQVYISHFANTYKQFTDVSWNEYTLYFNSAVDHEAPVSAVNAKTRRVTDKGYKMITYPYNIKNS